jgi:hemerythrin
MLLNCPIESFNPGGRIVRSGEEHEYLYFILSGLVEYINSSANVHTTLGAGAIAGEVSGILGSAAHGTYRTISVVHTLRISCAFYREFLARNGLLEEMKRSASLRRFLQNTWLFGDMISAPVKNRILLSLEIREWPAGADIVTEGRQEVAVVHKGEVEIGASNRLITKAGPGDFFGSEIAISPAVRRIRAVTSKPSVLCHIPASAFADVPAVQWKLLETYGRRMSTAQSDDSSAVSSAGAPHRAV